MQFYQFYHSFLLIYRLWWLSIDRLWWHLCCECRTEVAIRVFDLAPTGFISRCPWRHVPFWSCDFARKLGRYRKPMSGDVSFWRSVFRAPGAAEVFNRNWWHKMNMWYAHHFAWNFNIIYEYVDTLAGQTAYWTQNSDLALWENVCLHWGWILDSQSLESFLVFLRMQFSTLNEVRFVMKRTRWPRSICGCLIQHKVPT